MNTHTSAAQNKDILMQGSVYKTQFYVHKYINVYNLYLVKKDTFGLIAITLTSYTGNNT